MTVRIRCNGTDRPVDSAASVDRLLDGLEGDLVVPSLVELVGPGPVLHIGLGSDVVSVALYLDSDGRPHWGRSGDGIAWPADREIVFAKDGREHSFHSSAVIAPAVARQLARAFVNVPASPPTGVEWVPEP